jgi:uncharacterized protein
LSGNNNNDGLNFRSSLLSILILVTISLLLLATALAKNIFTEANASTEEGKSLYFLAPGISISDRTTSNNNTSSSDHYYMKANVRINGFSLIVDVPTTSEEAQKGLDIKDHLNENQGMLFIYEEPGKPRFWMYGMKFPIDIVWFDKDKNVVHIEHNLQPCITNPYNLLSFIPTTLFCPSYSPEKDALYVLETTAGFYQRHNVKVGTHMDFSLTK